MPGVMSVAFSLAILALSVLAASEQGLFVAVKHLAQCLTPATLGVLLCTLLRKREWCRRFLLTTIAVLVLVQLSMDRFRDRASGVVIEPSQDTAVLITGASSGIGRAIATSLAKRKFNVDIAGRNTSALEELAADLRRKYNVSVTTHTVDITADAASELLYESVTYKDKDGKFFTTTAEAANSCEDDSSGASDGDGRGRRIDMLVNCAGVAQRGNFVDTSLDAANSLLALNTKAVVNLTHLFASDMVRRRKGRIMIVSSLYGLAPGAPNIALYAATKAFLHSFALSLHYELAPFGISVTSLCAGATNTNFAKNMGLEDPMLLDHVGFMGLVHEAADVGESAVEAMLRGDEMYIPGLWNKLLYAGVISNFLPPRLQQFVRKMVVIPLKELLQWPDVLL